MIIAVDPGKSGGIAVRCDDGSVEVYKMPSTEVELVELMNELCEPGAEAYVELVGGYAGSGQPGSAMFTFGWWAGGITFTLLAFEVVPVMVPPQVWTKKLGLPPGTTRTALGRDVWKKALHAEAARRFPDIAFHRQVADALLILSLAEEGHFPKAL